MGLPCATDFDEMSRNSQYMKTIEKNQNNQKNLRCIPKGMQNHWELPKKPKKTKICRTWETDSYENVMELSYIGRLFFFFCLLC